MMLSVPLALVLGIVGIVLDGRKWPAIAVTVVSGGLVLFVVWSIVVAIVCL